MGVGPIPFFKTRDYGIEELGLEGEELSQFMEIIKQLDAEYLRLVNDTSKSKLGKKKPKDPDQEISVVDVDAQREMFKNLRARTNKRNTK